MKEKRLGMGLDALLGGEVPVRTEGPSNGNGNGANELAMDRLRPNPYQPRSEFDDNDISMLAESILRKGVLQPIMVRRNNGFYEIVAGERRFRAAQMAGLLSIPVVVRQVADDEMLSLALMENLQRKDLNPMEKARAFRQLMQINSWTQEQASESLGLARPTVANFLRLLELPSDVQEAVAQDAISMGHARALAGLHSRAQMLRLLQRVVTEDISVRSLERLIAVESRKARKVPGSGKDANIQDLESRLTQSLGTKVEIRQKGKSGEIAIHYYSTDQLNGLLQQLGA